MNRLFKAMVAVSLAVMILLSSTSCTGIYNPPEGYTEKHHTYEEILDFAKSLDENAIVSETYTDTQIKAWNRKFREWDAVINGIECHVSSVGDNVWDSTGEFPKQYYVIDTDYDYVLLNKIISENHPNWEMSYTDINNRYNWNGLVSIQYVPSSEHKLSSDELESIWENAYEIYTEYNSYPVRKAAWFCISTPKGEAIFYDFSPEGKDKFFEEYEKDFQ